MADIHMCHERSLDFHSPRKFDLVVLRIDVILILGGLLCVQHPQQVGAGDADLGLEAALAFPHLVAELHSNLVAALAHAHQVTRHGGVDILFAFQRSPDFEQLQNLSQHVGLDDQYEHSQSGVVGHYPTLIFILHHKFLLIRLLKFGHVLQELSEGVAVALDYKRSEVLDHGVLKALIYIKPHESLLEVLHTKFSKLELSILVGKLLIMNLELSDAKFYIFGVIAL